MANVLYYGSKYHIQNGYGGWDAKTNYLDTRGGGCNDNLMCVSTATSPDRDSGSGTWIISSATSKLAGEPVLSGDQIHLQNQYGSGAGGYLDTRGTGCNGNLMCVSTADSSDRTSGSGTWRIIKDSAGGVVHENDVVHLWNKWSDWTGGFLDTRAAGCQDNLYCVSACGSWDRDAGSTHWRFQS